MDRRKGAPAVFRNNPQGLAKISHWILSCWFLGMSVDLGEKGIEPEQPPWAEWGDDPKCEGRKGRPWMQVENGQCEAWKGQEGKGGLMASWPGFYPLGRSDISAIRLERGLGESSPERGCF